MRNDGEGDSGWLAGNPALFLGLFNQSGLLAGVLEDAGDDLRFVMANAVVSARNGRRPRGMPGLTGRDLGIPADEIQAGLEALRSCQAGTPTQGEFRRTLADGEHWIALTYSAVPASPQGAARAAFLGLDITASKRAALAHEQQRARLELALDAAAMGFWEYDIAADRLTWDERTRDLFALGDTEPVDWAEFVTGIHPDDGPRIMAAAEGARAGADGGVYRIEHRILADDGHAWWVESAAKVIFDAAGQSTHILGTVRDISGEVQGRERQALLLAEVNHRVKNSLATVQAIARQTAREADDAAAFHAVFEARIEALARAHDVLASQDWVAADLGALVKQTLGVFGDDIHVADGAAPIEVSAEQAMGLSLVLHELATNAVKHGALSTPEGSVTVAWAPAAERVEIEWRERGGPIVQTPRNAGFGARLLRSALSARDGRTEIRYEPEGLQAQITLRLRPQTTAEHAA